MSLLVQDKDMAFELLPTTNETILEVDEILADL
jgi:hypothetical protein